MRTIYLLTSLLAVVSLAACSTSSEDMALLHREITDVQRSVDTLQTEVIDQSDLQAMEKSMQDLTNQNLRSNADLAARVAALQEQIEGFIEAVFEVRVRRPDFGIGFVDERFELSIERRCALGVKRREDLCDEIVAAVAAGLDDQYTVPFLINLESLLWAEKFQVRLWTDPRSDVVDGCDEPPHQILIYEPRSELGVG